MDEIEFAVGDTVDFHGVEMNWAGDMTGAEMLRQFQNAYVPSLIRRDTVWTFTAGKPVYLLREPRRPGLGVAGVHQGGRSDLTPDNLDELGGKLKNLPKGWTFETKVLTKDLTLDTDRAAAGPRSSATTCTARTRGAGTPQTPAPTTCCQGGAIRDGTVLVAAIGGVPEIAVDQLDSMRKSGAAKPQLLDVRTPVEWRWGAVAGAIHVPITELGSRIAGLKLDPARPIVAICRAAHRSVPAVRLLRRHGFDNACQLQGGMLAWRRAGLPVETDADHVKQEA